MEVYSESPDNLQYSHQQPAKERAVFHIFGGEAPIAVYAPNNLHQQQHAAQTSDNTIPSLVQIRNELHGHRLTSPANLYREDRLVLQDLRGKEGSHIILILS